MNLIPLIIFGVLLLVIYFIIKDNNSYGSSDVFFTLLYLLFVLAFKFSLLTLAVIFSLHLLYPIIHIATTFSNSIRISFSLFMIYIATSLQFKRS